MFILHFNPADFLEGYDDLVIGGGSTGAVIAARLSEDPHRRVLLLEAGPDRPALQALRLAVHDHRQVAIAPGLNWKYGIAIKGLKGVHGTNEQPRDGAGGSRFDYEAGKLLGGSSAINAVQALRGVPEDFDEWARDCGEEWNWAGVLPYFRLLEDDPIGPDSLHGRGGPMPIRRERRDELRPLQAALMDACIAHGFAQTADHNDHDTTGVGVVPKNILDGARMSTAHTYLRAARGRPNLAILTGAHIHRLLWNGLGCSGAEAEIDGRLHRFQAGRVILCAGAMGTPPILMRSGIGAPGLLESLDIAVKAPLAGVGENLMDHPVAGIWGVPQADACTRGEPLRQTLLRYSSSMSGYRNDMHICMMSGMNVGEMFPNRASTASVSAIAGLTVCFNRSTSRGFVRIASTDPHAPLHASLNCLGEKSDIAPLMEGIRLGWRLLRHEGLRARFERILAWTDGMIESDVALERAIAAFVRPSAHLGGSAKMGRASDAGAVVDPQGRVYGVDNLWVADASIMPRIPSAPPHLTSLMIAEKIADGLKRRQ